MQQSKKVLHLSEMGFNGYLNENQVAGNWKAEITWIYGLNAYSCFYGNYLSGMEDDFDIIIAIIPKTKPEVMYFLKSLCEKEGRKYKIGIVQEGGHDYFMEYPMEYQMVYLDLLKNIDFLMAMNDSDVSFYENFMGKERIIRFYTPTRFDLIKDVISQKRYDKVMVGGNMTVWYQGTLSLAIAKKFNIPISLPTMGRRQKDENSNIISLFTGTQVEYIPYTNWVNWIKYLSEHKYAIHMMRIAGAGSFSLNCASVGIPCIGRNVISNQKDLFPELSLDENLKNYKGEDVNYIISMLRNQNEYDRIVKYAKEQLYKYDYIYSCNNIINKIESI